MNGILFLNTAMFEEKALYKKAFSLISEDRKEKINKIKTSMPAKLSLGAGLLLRILLDQYGLSEKHNEIKYGEHGKPFLADSDFYFSLSHSGEYVLCAYADTSIGADLQKVKLEIPKHTKKILSIEERKYLDTLEDTERIPAFYRLWTRKESLIKWDGRGLRIPLQEISFIDNGKMVDKVIFEGKTLYLKEFDWLLPQYTFCLCSESNKFTNTPFEVKKEFLTNY